MRVFLLWVWVCLPLLCIAQPAPVNQKHGAAVFRSNCAFCHGLDGHGGRGPSLASSRVSEASEKQLASIVRNGIAGTGMPAFELEGEDLQPLLAHLRSLGQADPAAFKIPGNAQLGKHLYDTSGCPSCHRVGAQGVVFGPDLSRIGASRSTEYLRESIVHPSSDIAAGFEGVTVITNEGKKTEGIRINEDTFTLQLRLPDQSFATFIKDELRSVIDTPRSLMPAYDHLATNDLDNLVAYLASLRSDPAGAKITRAQGIH